MKSLARVSAVARREYVEHVKTKSFILGLVLLPLLLGGSFFVQNLLEKAGGGNPVVVFDESGLGEQIASVYDNTEKYELIVETADAGRSKDRLDELIASTQNRDYTAVLYIPHDVLENGGVSFYTTNVSSKQPRQSVMRAVTNVVREARFASSAIDQALVQAIYAPVDVRDYDLSDKEGEASEVDDDSREAKSFIPMIFVYLMFIGIMGQAQTMLTSTVEEKSNRVMEVLISSVSPLELMSGKMIGLALVSLTLFAAWMAGGAFMIVRHDLQNVVEFSTLVYFLIYFFPGFLIYAGIMAALGSLCNDLKEAQNLMTPVMVILIIPLMLMFWVGQNPEHLISKLLSLIPVFTPFLMINRIASASPPGMFEVVLSLIVMIVSIYGVVWVASRIFRIGILLYGKQPAPKEVMRWVRES